MPQPCARTMRCVIARPSPVPRGLVVNQGAKSCEGSPSKPGPSSQTTSSRAARRRGPSVTPTRPRAPRASSALATRFTSTCVTWSGSQRSAASRGTSTSRRAAAEGVAQEQLGARRQVGDGHGAPVDAVPDHAAQAGDEALEALDLFAADVDLLGVEASRWPRSRRKTERKKLMG